jgi:hypothetical protein
MFRGSNPKEEGYLLPLKSGGEAMPYPFPLMSKGERNRDHDDRRRMSVAINDKGGDCWKIGCCH